MKSAVIKSMTAIACVSLLSGCGLSMREHRGYVMDETLTSAVQPGVDNKASVEKTLGQPTFTGQFSPNDWYYLSRETRAFAFRNPKVTDQSVLHVRFDQAGNVESVNTTDETLVAAINPVNATTPTLGRKRSFFEELLGGIGTISQPGLPGSQPQPGQ